MTKEQAIAVLQQHMMNHNTTSSEAFINAFIGLGMLEVDEPVEPNQLFFSAMGDVPMERRDVGKILAIINGLGLKLVEK
jgi:hypothetical protein